MGGAEKRPFVPNLVKATEQELPKTSSVFNVPDYWLNDLFSKPVSTSETGALNLRRHRHHPRLVLPPSPCGFGFIPLSTTSAGDIPADSSVGQSLEITLTGEAIVGRDLSWLTPKRRTHRIDQRNQAVDVGTVRHQTMRDYDLVRCINRQLTVIACDEALSRRQNAAIGIGKVALCPVRRAPIRGPIGSAVSLHAG